MSNEVIQNEIPDILVFYVNGEKVEDDNADPETTLLTYLRNNLHLTGSKLGCGEGGCGACTVMVSKWDRSKFTARHFSVNACLAPVVSMHLCAVTTVEGIGSTRTKLHAVQERLAKFHGSQCGFCTPGIVMSMYALLRNKRVPTANDIESCLQGNLCRCTGYRPILAAFETFTCSMGDKCCRINQDGGSDGYERYDTSQEPIFPPDLTILGHQKASQRSLTFIGERVTWHQPSNLTELLDLKAEYPEARIVTGNTEVGIEMHIRGRCYEHIICPTLVPEMNFLKVEDKGICIGSACSLTDVEEFVVRICEEKSLEETQILGAILKMLKLFAGIQIRNVASIGGNIMTASPISDLNPILLACGATLTFASTEERREVAMDDSFFTAYRKTKTKQKEVLLALRIPFVSKDDVIAAYKQSKRKEDDIAIVNAGMHVNFHIGTNRIQNLSLAYGGMAAVTKLPKTTMANAVGRTWDSSLLEDVMMWLSKEMTLTADAPGGMVEYRRTLVSTFFFKFYHHVVATLVDRGVLEPNGVNLSRKIVAGLSSEDDRICGTQTYQEVPESQRQDDTIGRPLPHLSGEKHTTGEAQYIDDLRPRMDELHMALVYSTRPHAKILNVDVSSAMSSGGVASYVDRNDVIGQNVIDGDEVFADGKVTCVGHVIGATVADSQVHAITASRLVKIEYEDLQPQIITIEDAIKNESFWKKPSKLKRGSVEDGLQNSHHTLDGEMRIGGQEHFYLETQTCIAIPKVEDDEMEIIAATQGPAITQERAALCLGVAKHKVTVRTKRLGGAFGGKEYRSCIISNAAAIAARKLGRPVRCMLTRQHDMQITGGRHPFLARYKVGFNADGRIVALHLCMYSNGGNTPDVSVAVMHKAMMHSDNCYRIPNMEVNGYVCKTNVTSNTAYRALGTPQAILVVEDIITRIGVTLGMESEQIRDINMYRGGDLMLCQQPSMKFLARRCLDECLEKSQFYKIRDEFREFNRQNRWKKRGVASIPSKYIVGFAVPFFNQAGAIVLIYTDGSVLLSHGGTEMGQGLYTKMTQVASRCLGIPVSIIHTSETTTSSVPNASATAASSSSDLNGMAVKNACEKLMERLEPLQKKNPGIKWQDLIKKAYEERISLSATGFYRTPGLNAVWDVDSGLIKGRMGNYVTYGAAVSQVEIDVLTGHHVVMRTDIVIDVGSSLNPAIDIGQIEGAFTQGYGMMTMEELHHSPSGHLLTTGPGSYKIPGFSNTPKKFNVHILRSCTNERAIYSSKAIGEPPLLLSSSIFFAIKYAISSARSDAGLSGPFRLDSPATVERIRMTCEDCFTDKARMTDQDAAAVKPWCVRT